MGEVAKPWKGSEETQKIGVKSLVGQTSPSPDEGRGGGTIDCREADSGTST